MINSGIAVIQMRMRVKLEGTLAFELGFLYILAEHVYCKAISGQGGDYKILIWDTSGRCRYGY